MCSCYDTHPNCSQLRLKQLQAFECDESGDLDQVTSYAVSSLSPLPQSMVSSWHWHEFQRCVASIVSICSVVQSQIYKQRIWIMGNLWCQLWTSLKNSFSATVLVPATQQHNQHMHINKPWFGLESNAVWTKPLFGACPVPVLRLRSVSSVPTAAVP